MSQPTGRQALPLLLNHLHEQYPDARYELNWSSPWELLVGAILAAQTKDEKVNRVTENLFAQFPTVQHFVDAELADIEEILRPVRHYRLKANAIEGSAKILVEKHEGEVPAGMDALLELPRVARKTANVVLTEAFNLASGVVVDSHVTRVSQRFGLTTQKKAEKIEPELMEMLPQEEWIFFGAAMILLGRYICTAKEAKCSECRLVDICEQNDLPNQGDGTVTEAEIPNDWKAILADEMEKPYFSELQEFVAKERSEHTIYPPEEDVFNALKFTPYDKVKVLLLGQDPYHGKGQAHGLCFSVQPGVKAPPSLVNIYKELKSYLGCEIPNKKKKKKWADQGILMLNAVLTVREKTPNSHKSKGWEKFTDAIIRAVNAKSERVVFVLWGGYAQKKAKLIDESKHVIVQSAHPSPLSVKKFLGSRPFSKVNEALEEAGREPIDWQID